jgi:hypothetical protein
MDKRLAGILLFLLTAGRAPAQLLQKDTLRPISIKTVPSGFAARPTAFFCRKEVQLQKITRLPLFIRLGSKEYVDELEQKKGRRNRQY